MASATPIRNEKGQAIGYKQGDTYMTAGGKTVAYVKNGVTLNEKGQVKGKGNQALRLF